MGKPDGIGETREGCSESGSAAKTQGRGPRKPFGPQISGRFAGNIDRAIEARARHDPLRPGTLASSNRPGWRPNAFSVPIESERRLYLFILTRFLHANRYPLRWKTL
jgi:hypothetical protein